MANFHPTTSLATEHKQLRIIGISGASRSGKTLLSNGLYNLIKADKSSRVVKIGQDRYFFDYRTLEAKLSNTFEVNWDHPSALDWEKFYSEITRVREALTGNKENCFIIVEGFMAFYEERLRDMFDTMIWLEIDKLTCYTRRMSTFWVSENYFHTKLWQNYVTYRNLLFEEIKAPLHVIDGNKSLQVILQTAENIINK